MILPRWGSGDIWEVEFLWRSKAWPEETFLDSGMWWQIRIIIYWLKQWMWIVVSMTDVEFVARRILICYTIMKNGWKAKMRGCRTVIIWVFEWKSCQVLRWIVSILNWIKQKLFIITSKEDIYFKIEYLRIFQTCILKFETTKNVVSLKNMSLFLLKLERKI